MSQIITHFFMDNVVGPLAQVILPLMFTMFVFGLVTRLLVYYTVKTEMRFAREFEKRVVRYLADPQQERIKNFYKLTRLILEKTYFECFELRKRYQRRRLDHVMTVSDRLFLMQDGAQRLAKDTLKQLRYLRKDGPAPRLNDLTKGVFDINPVFTRVLGIVPIGTVNELLGILPGLFVIGGIFGTFLGVSHGLPALGGMDLSNMDATKKVMDGFLGEIALAMISSTIGIMLSVLMTVFNTVFAADGIYFNLVNTYSGALETLWNETTENVVDREDIAEDYNSRENRPRLRSPSQVKPTSGSRSSSSGRTSTSSSSGASSSTRSRDEEMTRRVKSAAATEEATRQVNAEKRTSNSDSEGHGDDEGGTGSSVA